MDKKELHRCSLALVNDTVVGIFGYRSVHTGYPCSKAMVILAHEDLQAFYFYTPRSSNKAVSIRTNPDTSLYFQDFVRHYGLSLYGTSEIIEDPAVKKQYWRDSLKLSFPGGYADPEMIILKFTSNRADYFDSQHSHEFLLD